MLTQTLAYPIIRGAIADLFDEAPGSADVELVMAQNFVPLGVELSIGVVREMVVQTKGERSIFVSAVSIPSAAAADAFIFTYLSSSIAVNFQIGYQNDDGDIYIMPHHSEHRIFKHGESLVVFQRKMPVGLGMI